MKFFFIIFSFTIYSFWSQDIKTEVQQQNNVNVTTSGRGNTLTDATNNALREAISQTYGVFISSKTSIINDSLLKDEIVALTSGTIEKYEILNQTEILNSGFSVIVNSEVSINKLNSYAKSKGAEVLFDGGLFAFNINQMKLNEINEINAIYNLIGILHETVQTAFNFEIQTSDPNSIDNSSDNWRIELVVNVKTNENINIVNELLMKTLNSIGLSTEQCNNYNNLKKTFFPFEVNNKQYYFRCKSTLEMLNSFFGGFGFYTRNFNVNSEIHYLRGTDLDKFDEYLWKGSINNDNVYLFNANELIVSYNRFDVLNIKEVQRLKKYTVSSNGIVSHFMNGGFVVRMPSPERFVLGIDTDVNNRIISLPTQFPAYQNGLNLGDLVLTVNNENYSSINQIKDAIKLGKEISLTVQRESLTLHKNISPVLIPKQNGLVVAPFNSDQGSNYQKALELSSVFNLGGFHDWYIPSKEDWGNAYKDLYRFGIGNPYSAGFSNFWSSTDIYGELNLIDVTQTNGESFERFSMDNLARTRLMRSF